MATSAQSLRQLLRATALGAVLWAHSLHAADTGMPDGVAVVTSRTGSIQITDTDGAKASPELHETLTLSDRTIQTGKNAHIFFALSNGLGFGIGENSRGTIRVYEQKPFRAEKESLEHEPSASKFIVEITEGTFAIESKGLSPLSDAQLLTPTGALRTDSANCVVQQDETGTTITVYKGNASFHYPDGKNREFLEESVSLRISPQSSKLGKPAEQIDSASLPEAHKRFSDAVRHASQRVYFKAPETGERALPVLITPVSYFKQAPARPYGYRE